MKTLSKQATPIEAEEIAIKAVTDYLNACKIETTDRVMIGNFLIKLTSVTAVVMAKNEGSAVAAERLVKTAAFILNKMPKEPASLTAIH